MPNWWRPLGENANEIELSASFERAIEMHGIVMAVDMAHNFHRDYEQGRDKLSPVLRALIEKGRTYPAVEYTRALAGSANLNGVLDAVFDEYDAILTPAAPGPAPRGDAQPATPHSAAPGRYLGTPAVTLPLLQDEDGMPIGVQLVGRRGNDARLLRTARWLVNAVEGGGGKRAKAGAARPKKRKVTS